MVGFAGGLAGGAAVTIVIQAIDKFSGTFSKAQQNAKILGGAMIGIGAAMAVGVTKAVKQASDLEESMNAVSVVFGEGADEIFKFGETAANSIGMATSEFNQMSAVTGALLKDVGMPMKEVANLTNDLSVRAADLASVFNTDVSDAMSAINQALRGETEAIRRYAGDVTDATLETFLLSKGIDKQVTSLTQQEKRLYRVQLIMEQTANVAGDFANTSDSLANRQRILSANIKDAQAALAQGLLPAFEAIVGVMMGVVAWFNNLSEGTQRTIGIIIAVTSVLFIMVGAIILVTLAVGMLSAVSLPLIVIIAAIIAIVVGIIIIIAKWRKILLTLTVIIIKVIQGWVNIFDFLGTKVGIIFAILGNFIKIIWNGIVKTIQGAINIIIDMMNSLINAINRIPGIEIPLIPKVNLSGALAEVEKVSDIINRFEKERAEREEKRESMANSLISYVEEKLKIEEDITTEIEKQTEETKKQQTIQEQAVAAGLKIIPSTGDVYDPSAGSLSRSDFESRFAFKQAGMGAGVNVTIENVYGTDPEEISRALNDTLNNTGGI